MLKVLRFCWEFWFKFKLSLMDEFWVLKEVEGEGVCEWFILFVWCWLCEGD